MPPTSDPRQSDPRTSPTAAVEAQPPEKTKFFGLSIPQLLGGACAAMSMAVLTSFLGAAGTLIGAALGSILSTVIAAVYTTLAATAQHHVRRGVARLGNTKDASDGSKTGYEWSSDSDSDPALTVASPKASRRAALRKGLKPRPILAAAGLIFVIAIGTITVLEFGLGRPVTATGTSNSSTTIGQVFKDVSGQSSETPTDEETPSDSTTETPGSGENPTTDSSSGQGDGDTSGGNGQEQPQQTQAPEETVSPQQGEEQQPQNQPAPEATAGGQG